MIRAHKSTSTLLLAGVSVLVLSNAAYADYTFYGKAEVQISKTDTGAMNYVDKGTQIDAPFSRIGVKGTHQLNDDLKAVYKYEVQAKGFEDSDTLEPFVARNTYLGVAGKYGELVVGRNDTRFKYSEGKVDLFNETQADIAQLIPGQARLGDTLTFNSATFANSSLHLTYAPKDDSKNLEAGYAATFIYGDRSLNEKPYYVSLSRVDGLNQIVASRIVGVFKYNNFQAGALFQRSENSEGTKSGNGVTASVSYKLDKWVPKLQYVKDTSKIRYSEEGEQWTVGTDYVFDKQSKIYVLYTDLQLEEADDNSMSIGMQYKF